jgi:NAD(P)-dependent dehydrogenase (short-subunit alcohol dehydrogenase family)
MRLKGKAAIITGAASGLGRAIAQRYAEEGADILIADIDISRARVVASELSKLGTKVLVQEVDVAFEAPVAEMTERAIGEFGKIDILVNNAGMTTLRDFLDLPPAEWDLVMAINLRGPFLCSQSVGRRMAERMSGSIINISSVEQDFASANRVHFTSSKSGLKALTKGLALSLAPYNIRVNTLSPGGFDTEIMAKHFPDEETLEAFKTSFKKRIPMRRLGRPEEIGGAAVFLACDDSSYMTGSQLDLNGGASIPVPSDP